MAVRDRSVSGGDNGVLLRAWQDDRDETAFTNLCERHRTLVLRTARTFGSPDAEDAMQSVFMVLAQKSETIGNPAQVTGWLLGTTRRIVANQRRVTTRRIRLEQCALPTNERLLQAHPETIGVVDMSIHLDRAIAALSPLRRDALIRFYLNGQSQLEIATELGCSVGTIKSRIHEALAKLRGMLAGRGVTDESAVLSRHLNG